MSDVVCEMHHATWPYTISLRRSTLPPPAVPLLWRPRHSGKEQCYFSIIHKVKKKQFGSRPLFHRNVSALSNSTIFFVSLYYSVFTTFGNETVNKTNAINYLLWNIAIIREKFQRPSEPCCLNRFLYQFSPLSTFQRTEALIRYVFTGLDCEESSRIQTIIIRAHGISLSRSLSLNDELICLRRNKAGLRKRCVNVTLPDPWHYFITLTPEDGSSPTQTDVETAGRGDSRGAMVFDLQPKVTGLNHWYPQLSCRSPRGSCLTPACSVGRCTCIQCKLLAEEQVKVKQ